MGGGTFTGCMHGRRRWEAVTCRSLQLLLFMSGEEAKQQRSRISEFWFPLFAASISNGSVYISVQLKLEEDETGK